MCPYIVRLLSEKRWKNVLFENYNFTRRNTIIVVVIVIVISKLLQIQKFILFLRKITKL